MHEQDSRMKPLLYPFQAGAPLDTLDGMLEAEGIVTDRSDPGWLKCFRSLMLPRLRAVCATGVTRYPGETNRHAYIRAICERDDVDRLTSCCICGLPTTRAASEVDHIIPLSQGGRHHIDNLGLAHGSCNSFKRSSIEVNVVEARARLIAYMEHRGWWREGLYLADEIRSQIQRESAW